MNTSSHPASPPLTGLCGTCRHARQIRSDRGSCFLLCRRAASDPAFARYPRLPVSTCTGFEPEAAPSETRNPASG